MRRPAVRGALALAGAMTAAAPLMAAVPLAASAATSGPAGPAALGSTSRGQVVWGWGDSAGYHLAVYAAGQSRQIALLRPAGLDVADWTGSQCVSGDLRYAAVVTGPSDAANTPAGRAVDAFAYSVNLATGQVDYGYYPGTAFSGTVAIAAITAPANDDFARAQPITAAKVYTINFANATTQPGEPHAWPGEADHGSVWYSYRPSKSVTMTLSSPASTDDVVAGLFTGQSVRSLKRLNFNWLGPGHGWTITLSAGRTYHIAIDNYDDPQDKTSGIPPALRFELKATVKPRLRSTSQR